MIFSTGLKKKEEQIMIDEIKIGKYLDVLINDNYDSQNDFCREWDKKDNCTLKNKPTVLSAIINGSRPVQPHYLLIFSELLGVSCEEILSAGEKRGPLPHQNTNYELAKNKNVVLNSKKSKKQWLNSDEYGNTILDYAIENKNYKIIKQLLEKGHIKLSEHPHYAGKNGAVPYSDLGIDSDLGKCSFLYYTKYLGDNIEKESIELRNKVIAAAIRHNDLYLLNSIHARENDFMYDIPTYARNTYKYPLYSEELIEAIADSSESSITDYFTDEIDIDYKKMHSNSDKSNDNIKLIYSFLYSGELADKLIKINSSKIETVLKKILEHNQNIDKQVKEYIEHKAEPGNFYDCVYEDPLELARCISMRINVSKDQRLITINDHPCFEFAANIIHINEKSKNTDIQSCIDAINIIHNKLSNITKTIIVKDKPYDLNQAWINFHKEQERRFSIDEDF